MTSYIYTRKYPLLKGLLLCFLLWTLIACTNTPVFDRNLEIKDQSWSNNDIKEFLIPISDSQNNYTLYLNIRHGFQYPFSDLALSIQEISPDKQEKTYLLKIELAEVDGRWKGTGSGNIFHNQVSFLTNHHFADTGTYIFKIKPVMHQNPITGIINIGIRVDKNL